MNVLRIVLPVVLGIVAAVLNFMVLRGSTAPSELTAIRSNVPANTELTAEMLEPLQVRRSDGFQVGGALLAAGAVAGAANQTLIGSGRDPAVCGRGEPRSGKCSPVPQTRRIDADANGQFGADRTGLRRGDPVGVLVAARPENAKKPTTPTMPAAALSDRRILGPFRLLGLRAPVDTSHRAGMGDVRMVIVAVTRMPDDRLAPSIAALDEAIAAGATSSDGSGGGVLAVEYYQPAK